VNSRIEMTKHVDLTELNNVADGDQEFMKETMSLLMQEIPENLEHINKYVAQNDMNSLKALIHKMKSSFMLIGMKEIWPVIGLMEKAQSADAFMKQVPEFVRICNESVEELKSMQNVI
jgi:HPt (histidine-containing phosphotransfer) domain-containing protein